MAASATTTTSSTTTDAQPPRFVVYDTPLIPVGIVVWAPFLLMFVFPTVTLVTPFFPTLSLTPPILTCLRVLKGIVISPYSLSASHGTPSPFLSYFAGRPQAIHQSFISVQLVKASQFGSVSHPYCGCGGAGGLVG